MNPRHATGFSLAEMAIVLLILSLLGSGALLALRVQTEHSRFTRTQAALLEAKQALLAFAATQGRLPCPADPAERASNNFGLERVNDYTATSPVPSCEDNRRRGLIPWKTLGIQGTDAWDQYLSYEVTSELTSNSTLKTTTDGKIVAHDTYSEDRTADPALAFALWSQGANGNGAFTVQNTVKSASSNVDEQANAPSNPKEPLQVILHAENDDFDDVGLKVSRYVLFKQMIDAGWSIPRK